MAFDGFVTRAIVDELQELVNSKIYKIYQPHQTDLVFILRGYGKNINLLISANPTYPRINITNKSYTNPLEPPMFCMLLRKHLEGGIIEAVTQVDHERIIYIDIKVKDELGDVHTKRLIVEIMGRHSNIILINPDKNMILDGINHVTPAISSYRIVLPGREYIAPPKQEKHNPLVIDRDKFLSLIQFNEGKLDKQLVDKFIGTSPTVAKEILYQAGLPTRENLWISFNNWMEKVRNKAYQPTIVIGEEKAEFSILPLTHLSGIATHYDSINACLEDFYDKKADRDVSRQKALDLSKLLINEKQKNEKKIEHLLKDLDSAKSAELYQFYGELLTANIYKVKKGDTEVIVVDYYDAAESLLSIKLDPLKTPSENIQHYYKKYSKLKASRKYIDEQLEKTKEELEYLDAILTQLESASVTDIEEIREELVEQGYLRERKRNIRKKNKTPQIEQYISSEGIIIFVGKNNIQNEYLTNKLASHTDTWLHTKDIPGSHVVIRSREFGETTLAEAAMIAAYFSKAKQSSQVPVDYTLIKHVKKPNGSKPGFVIYDNQKTIYVTPDEKKVDELRKKAAK